MTPADYRNKVKTELDDTGVMFTDSEINSALAEAYYFTLLFGKGLVKEVSLNFPTAPYVKITTLVPDYFSSILLYNKNTKQFLTPLSNKHLEAFDPEWDTKEGNSAYFTTFGFDHLGIFPHYSSTPPQQLTMIYQAVPPLFSTEAAVQLPDSFYWLLVNHAVARLLESVFEFSKALLYWQDYSEDFRRYKRFNAERVKIDFLRGMVQNAVGL